MKSQTLQTLALILALGGLVLAAVYRNGQSNRQATDNLHDYQERLNSESMAFRDEAKQRQLTILGNQKIVISKIDRLLEIVGTKP